MAGKLVGFELRSECSFFTVAQYREVQLNVIAEMKVFYMLFEICHTKK